MAKLRAVDNPDCKKKNAGNWNYSEIRYQTIPSTVLGKTLYRMLGILLLVGCKWNSLLLHYIAEPYQNCYVQFQILVPKRSIFIKFAVSLHMWQSTCSRFLITSRGNRSDLVVIPARAPHIVALVFTSSWIRRLWLHVWGRYIKPSMHEHTDRDIMDFQVTEKKL